MVKLVLDLTGFEAPETWGAPLTFVNWVASQLKNQCIYYSAYFFAEGQGGAWACTYLLSLPAYLLTTRCTLQRIGQHPRVENYCLYIMVQPGQQGNASPMMSARRYKHPDSAVNIVAFHDTQLSTEISDCCFFCCCSQCLVMLSFASCTPGNPLVLPRCVYLLSQAFLGFSRSLPPLIEVSCSSWAFCSSLEEPGRKSYWNQSLGRALNEDITNISE